MRNEIFTLPNMLSLLRIPLACLFLFEDTFIRCIALVLAGCTDMLDGYLARRWGVASQWGAMIDPLADKCCAAIVFTILWMEGTLNLPQIGALLTREIMLCCFALVLFCRGELKSYNVRAIWTGKIITTLQGIIVLLLILQQPVPMAAYLITCLLGLMSLVELMVRPNPRLPQAV